MAIDFNSAISAYNTALTRAKSAVSTGSIDGGGFSPVKPVAPIGGDDDGGSAGGFAGVLKSSMQGFEQQQRKAEHLTKLAIAGKADILEVTMAVNDAETTLQSVIQIRDKVVAAYKEILAMPM